MKSGVVLGLWFCPKLVSALAINHIASCQGFFYVPYSLGNPGSLVFPQGRNMACIKQPDRDLGPFPCSLCGKEEVISRRDYSKDEEGEGGLSVLDEQFVRPVNNCIFRWDQMARNFG